MFSFAAFLGFDLQAGLHGLVGAMAAVIALFAPGFLFIGAILPFWSDLGRLSAMRRALRGVMQRSSEFCWRHYFNLSGRQQFVVALSSALPSLHFCCWSVGGNRHGELCCFVPWWAG